jgi:hypothetical protein
MEPFKILSKVWSIKGRDWMFPKTNGHLPAKVTKTFNKTTVLPEESIACPSSNLPCVFQYDDNTKTIHRLCLRNKCLHHDYPSETISIHDPHRREKDPCQYLKDRHITVLDIIRAMKREEIIDNHNHNIEYDILHLPNNNTSFDSKYVFRITNLKTKCSVCKGHLKMTFYPVTMKLDIRCQNWDNNRLCCSSDAVLFDLPLDVNMDSWIVDYTDNEYPFYAYFDYKKYLYNFVLHRLDVLQWYTGCDIMDIRKSEGNFSQGVYYLIFDEPKNKVHCFNEYCPGTLVFGVWTIQCLLTRTCSCKTCPYTKWKKHNTKHATIEDLYPHIEFDTSIVPYDPLFVKEKEVSPAHTSPRH